MQGVDDQIVDNPVPVSPHHAAATVLMDRTFDSLKEAERAVMTFAKACRFKISFRSRWGLESAAAVTMHGYRFSDYRTQARC